MKEQVQLKAVEEHVQSTDRDKSVIDAYAS